MRRRGRSRKAALVCFTLLASACLGLASCTLGFDTDSVPFNDGQPDAGDQPDADLPDTDAPNNDAPNNDPNNTPNNDVSFVREALGQLCGINPATFCVPESDDWPACANATCASLGGEAVCMLGNVSPVGFCSSPCKDDTECTGIPQDPFASTMRCVSDGGARGWCMPGSQQECISELECPDNESCKPTQRVLDGELVPGTACQTRRPNTAAPGAFCNDDPRRGIGGAVKPCRTDICLDDICLALCGAEGEDEVCGNPNLTCTEVEGGAICLPTSCQGPATCAPSGELPAVCAPRGPRREEGPRPGQCRVDNPSSRGSRLLSETCDEAGEPDSIQCGSRYCTGKEPYFYCSALCETQDDCPSNMLCAVRRTSDGFGNFFIKECVYAPGSQRRCDTLNARCSDPEVCAPFLFGTLGADATTLDSASAEGRCITPVPGGVDFNAVCEGKVCRAPGACVSVGDQAGQCTQVCNSFLDCENFQDCAQVSILSDNEHGTGGQLTLGFCVEIF